MEQFEILGLKEVEEAISALPIKMQAQIYKALNRKAVKQFVVDPIKGAWADASPRTIKGIQIVNDREDKTAVYGGVTSKAFWLRFADLGTAMRETQKGASRGAITGRKRIQPIIQNSVDEIVKYMNEEIGNEMIKILEKRIKSTQKKLSQL